MKALVTAKFPEKYYDQLYEIVSEASFAGRGHTGYKLTAEEMITAIGDAELVIDGIEEIDGKVQREVEREEE